MVIPHNKWHNTNTSIDHPQLEGLRLHQRFDFLILGLQVHPLIHYQLKDGAIFQLQLEHTALSHYNRSFYLLVKTQQNIFY